MSSHHTSAYLNQILSQYYNIEGVCNPLQGEEDYNYHVLSKAEAYTLKISRAGASKDAMDFQASIISHLKRAGLGFDIPAIVKTIEGADYVNLDNDVFVRLQKWVPGRLLGKVNPISKDLYVQWGRLLGQMTKTLADFDHPYAHRFYKWDPSQTLASKKNLKYFQTDEEIEIAKHFWSYFEEEIAEPLSDLRKSVNYNDGHDFNILVDENKHDPQVSGIIDFGDTIYTETINEIAIACAYGGMNKSDPLKVWAQMIKGYHLEFTLQDDELKLLYGLIAARLMITVASAAENLLAEPENEYLQVSAAPAWNLLKKMKEINPKLTYYTFRDSCGMDAHPNSNEVANWLENNKKSFAPILNWERQKLTSFDLSIGSLSLGNNWHFNEPNRFQANIDRMLLEADAQIGYGGYLEIRPFYSTDIFATEEDEGAVWRAMHLGIDFWTKECSSIYLPIAGVVHSFANNEGDSNYGPTLIVEHRTDSGIPFYTLYGHLSEDSILQKSVGETLEAGTLIGTMGEIAINGSWPIHLHFQIFLDTLGNEGDFQGLAFAEEKSLWSSICLDPLLAIELDSKKEDNQKTKTQISETRKEMLGSNLSVSYDEPLLIQRGYMQYLYNDHGKRYLDMVNNVPHVGHQHHDVVKRASQQIAVLNTNTRYLHDQLTDYAEALLETFPDPLSVVYFVNSGSEANELALRMVSTFTDSKQMIAVASGYHGSTGRCVEVSSYKFDGKGGKGAPDCTQVVPMPDVFRGDHRDINTAGNDYATYVESAIDNLIKSDTPLGGFICEPILSCGGQMTLPQAYLSSVYKKVRAANGLCISDEVQVGFGRVGKHFWGFQLHDVIPDIVTMGKPIGNGHPLGAVVTTRAIADRFANGMEYFSTFGGNPVSCAIGLEVLKIVKCDKLQEHALAIGTYLKEALLKLKSEFPIIGDVRGEGLFVGIELVKDLQSLEPAKEEAHYLVNRMKYFGVLLSTDGPLKNVIKIKPPMCFDRSNADYFIKYLKLVLQDDFLNL